MVAVNDPFLVSRLNSDYDLNAIQNLFQKSGRVEEFNGNDSATIIYWKFFFCCKNKSLSRAQRSVFYFQAIIKFTNHVK